jgi:hypothetical protein
VPIGWKFKDEDSLSLFLLLVLSTRERNRGILGILVSVPEGRGMFMSGCRGSHDGVYYAEAFAKLEK